MSQKIYSLIWAIMLMTAAYIAFFEAMFGISRSITLIVIASAVVMLFFGAFNLERKLIFSRNVAIILCSICIVYIFSLNNLSKIGYTFIHFSFYFLIPCVLVCQRANVECILRYCIYMSLILFFAIDKMMFLHNVGLLQADMYNTYAFVPCIIAALCYFCHFRNNDNFLLRIGYIMNLYYIIRVGANAVRGFWVVIIFYVFFEIIFVLQKNNTKKGYLFLCMIGALLFLLIIINMGAVLEFTIPFLERILGDNVGFIVKMNKLIQSGDLSNGRIEIWTRSLYYFGQSPLWGNGLESIVSLSNGNINYPHNFILQILVDCGLFFGLFPVIITISSLFRLLFGTIDYSYEKVFAMYLASISIPISFLSGDVWKSVGLWLTILYFAHNQSVLKNGNK